MNARTEDTHPLPWPLALGAGLLIYKIATVLSPAIVVAVGVIKALGAMVMHTAGDLALAATAGLLIALSIGAVTKGRP